MSEGTEVAVPENRAPRHIGDLNGVEKAAMLMLALGEQNGKEIWMRLEQDEIKEISAAMSKLGGIDPKAYEDVMINFVSKISTDGAMTGNIATTESLLRSFLSADQVELIMEEIRGPAGRNMWEKLSNVQANVLASY
ncbi:MAG: flagellar motor switch protein FliG, partial [Pseudomonadota bacterium]